MADINDYKFPFIGAGEAGYFEWAGVKIVFQNKPDQEQRKKITKNVPPPINGITWEGNSLSAAGDQFIHAFIAETYETKDGKYPWEKENWDGRWFLASLSQITAFNKDIEKWLNEIHEISPILVAFRGEDYEAGGTEFSEWHEWSMKKLDSILPAFDDVLENFDFDSLRGNVLRGILVMKADKAKLDEKYTNFLYPGKKEVESFIKGDIEPLKKINKNKQKYIDETFELLTGELDIKQQSQREMLIEHGDFLLGYKKYLSENTFIELSELITSIALEKKKYDISQINIVKSFLRGDIEPLKKIGKNGQKYINKTFELLIERYDIKQQPHKKMLIDHGDFLLGYKKYLSENTFIELSELITSIALEEKKYDILQIIPKAEAMGDIIAQKAYSLLIERKYSESIYLFDIALEMGGKNLSLYSNALYVLQKDNTGLPVNPELNRKFLKKCLPHAPQNPAIYFNACGLYVEMQEYNEAYKMVQKAIEHKYNEINVMRQQIEELDLFKVLREKTDILVLFKFTWDQLSKAIMEGDILVIRKFLESDGSFENITLIDSEGFGRSPLELAAIAEANGNGSAEITKIILENSSEEVQADALIGFASEDDYLHQAKSLLEAGIQPDIMKDNRTALQLAVGNKNPKMVYLLLSYGADPKKEGEYGTALESAGNDELYKGMLESAINGKVEPPYYFIDLEGIKTELMMWANSIQVFARQNSDNVFYVFGIDAGYLVANSEDEFIKTLEKYNKDWPGHYETSEQIQALKYNAGDFSFHIPMLISNDTEIEKIELDFSFLEPQKNENRTEDEILRDGLILNRNVIFKNLKITDDFKIYAFKHIY